MDVSGIIRSLMRHRLLSAVIIVVTALAAGYVYFGTPNSYSASADFAISDPPYITKADAPLAVPAAAPTTPAASVTPNANNPYLGFPDASTLIGALLSRMGSDSQVKALRNNGLSGAYDVVRSDAVAGGRLVSISVTTTTPDGALADVKLVTSAMETQLKEMQTDGGATDDYVYHLAPVTADDAATPEVSGKLRSVILVAIVGLLALATGVSTADAMQVGRRRRGPATEATPATAEQTALRSVSPPVRDLPLVAPPAVAPADVAPADVVPADAAPAVAPPPDVARPVVTSPVVAPPVVPVPAVAASVLPQPVRSAWSEPAEVTTSAAAAVGADAPEAVEPAPMVAAGDTRAPSRTSGRRRRQAEPAPVEAHRALPRTSGAELATQRRTPASTSARRRGVASSGAHTRPPS